MSALRKGKYQHLTDKMKKEGIRMVKTIQPKWAGVMTDRERFNRQMHYQKVDRCFNMEFGYWQENFSVWKMFLDNNITNNGQADRFFNFDTISSVSGNIWMSPAFEKKIIEERENTVIMENSDGFFLPYFSLFGEHPNTFL